MGKANIEDKLGITKASPKNFVLIGYFLILCAILVLVVLVYYNPANYHVSPQSESTLIFGKFGTFTAHSLFGIFGLSAWLLPWLIGSLGLLSVKKTNAKEKLFKSLTISTVIVSISVLANIRDDESRIASQKPILDANSYIHGAGGSIGAILYSGQPIGVSINQLGGGFKIWLGSFGTMILFLIILFSCLCFHFSFSPIHYLEGFRRRLNQEKKQLDGDNGTLGKSDSFKLPEIFFNKLSNLFALKSQPKNDLLFGDVSQDNVATSTTKSKKSHSSPSTIHDNSSSDLSDNITIKHEKTDQTLIKEKVEEPPKKEINSSEDESMETEGMEGFKVVRAAKTEKSIELFPERKGDYHFPPMHLLMDPPEEEAIGDEDHILKAKRLQDTLREFKIEVEMGEVHTGPVITRYDLHPAAGVRVEKIANLDKNLAMALKAESVRILAPVPGKGCVGIEVPNAVPMPVCMKEILQSKAWHEAGAEIPIVLGKEASGKPLVADLTKMPHLLVAGSTGSGKTVCINAIIASLCYHSSPEDVRFIMVDPKIVEMKVYNDLPHMLIPVVTEPKKVPGALKWLLVEMERRYQIFSKVGVRNIAGFNAKILKDKAEKEKAQIMDAEMTAEERAALSSIEVPRDDDILEIPENKLPYIVCIIDELADLMMVAQADVETGIARLAQLARAAGIHLIIATQRPSVNVITGVIKANLPSRISFRVASYRDSQTILDGKGAEALIGKGDMLFIPPGSSTFARAQGAFVSDDEINGIVEYLKINGPPQIIEEVREQIESAGQEDVLGEDGDSDDDPMTRRAIEIIRTTKRASTSNLQRKLSIGYNRAARIMDDLEDRGLVGPDIAGQGREILMDL